MNANFEILEISDRLVKFLSFWSFFVEKWQCLCEIFIRKIQKSTKNQGFPWNDEKVHYLHEFNEIWINCSLKSETTNAKNEIWKIWVIRKMLLSILCVDDWYWRWWLETCSSLRHPHLCTWYLKGHWVHLKIEKPWKMKKILTFCLDFWTIWACVWHYLEDNFSTKYRYLYWINSNWLANCVTLCV